MGWKITTSIVLVAMATGLFLSGVFKKQPEPLTIQDNYWGRGAKPTSKSKEQTSINSFTVKVSDADLIDLKNRLKNVRMFEALEDVGFQNGFNVDYMKELVAYWKDKYDWRKQEAHLNTLPHYKTKIEGIDVHFIHVKPKLKPGQTAKPLLIAHGWPGSVFEFYKIIPMLVDPTNHGGSEEDVFEVIAPSIPGYGFSEMPHKKGFDGLAVAQIYLKLMERLGFEKYYVQGGDWGAVITRIMAILKPSAIRGLHTNMPGVQEFDAKHMFYTMLGSVAPSLAGLTEEDYNRVYPFSGKILDQLQESGYMHIQSTKPDTVGFGLTDSPVGLAAYILEKFSTATNKDNRELADGGLDKYFTKDELLTSVMIYWWSRSITSSMRIYKELWLGRQMEAMSMQVTVPAGVAMFPNEITHVPESWCYWGYPNLVHYTMMPSGGHFAALEEPALLAQDIRAFVRKVEALEKS